MPIITLTDPAVDKSDTEIPQNIIILTVFFNSGILPHSPIAKHIGTNTTIPVIQTDPNYEKMALILGYEKATSPGTYYKVIVKITFLFQVKSRFIKEKNCLFNTINLIHIDVIRVMQKPALATFIKRSESLGSAGLFANKSIFSFAMPVE